MYGGQQRPISGYAPPPSSTSQQYPYGMPPQQAPHPQQSMAGPYPPPGHHTQQVYKTIKEFTEKINDLFLVLFWISSTTTRWSWAGFTNCWATTECATTAARCYAAAAYANECWPISIIIVCWGSGKYSRSGCSVCCHSSYASRLIKI
jgi:hypothetical protein